jgi:hypothetical protein
MGESDSRAVIRAFAEVFDDCSLWTGSAREWILLGVRDHDQRVTELQYTRQWRDPLVGRAIRDLGFESPYQLPSFFIADGPDLRALTHDTLPLIDNYPQRLSTTFGLKGDARYAEMMDPVRSSQRLMASEHIRRLFPPAILQNSLTYFNYRLYLHDVMTRYPIGENTLPQAKIHHVLTSSSLKTLVLWLLNTDAVELRLAKQALARGEQSGRLFHVLAREAIALRQYDRAVLLYKRAMRQSPGQLSMVYDLMFALCMADRRDEAQQLANRMPRGLKPPPWVGVWWLFAEDKLGLKQPGALHN